MRLLCLLTYFEYLVKCGVPPNMLAYHVLSIKFILYDVNYMLLDHPKTRYFVRSMKINTSLVPVTRNIMTIDDLTKLVSECDSIYGGSVFKDKHWTIKDITISDKNMTVAIKLSKALQTMQ